MYIQTTMKITKNKLDQALLSQAGILWKQILRINNLWRQPALVPISKNRRGYYYFFFFGRSLYISVNDVICFESRQCNVMKWLKDFFYLQVLLLNSYRQLKGMELEPITLCRSQGCIYLWDGFQKKKKPLFNSPVLLGKDRRKRSS